MVRGHCMIVPNEHVLTLLDCDDDEWTEIRNFQKSVIRMFDAINQGIMIYLRPYFRCYFHGAGYFF